MNSQERLIGEIEKLRNEIDHLKRRSGAFGDGTHPRYTSAYPLSQFQYRFYIVKHLLFMVRTFITAIPGHTWEVPVIFAFLWLRAKMATTARL